MRRFWNWVRDGDADRTLYFDGVIAEETWFQDDITPETFRAELMGGDGPVTIFLNSPGGCCFAASQIYTMLMEYPHDVTIKIDGIAASAASVIAMAGTRVLMAPTALLMIHNPLSHVMGDTAEMRKAIHMLEEVKDSILNAYEIKTGLPRDEISRMMDAETWISAGRAVELGFADGMLTKGDTTEAQNRAPDVLVGFAFSRTAATNSLLDKMKLSTLPAKPGTPIADLDKRLALLL